MTAKRRALSELAIWADVEHEARQKRVEWSVASRRAGATLDEIAYASGKSRQGVGKAIKKLGVTIDNHVRGV